MENNASMTGLPQVIGRLRCWGQEDISHGDIVYYAGLIMRKFSRACKWVNMRNICNVHLIFCLKPYHRSLSPSVTELVSVWGSTIQPWRTILKKWHPDTVILPVKAGSVRLILLCFVIHRNRLQDNHHPARWTEGQTTTLVNFENWLLCDCFIGKLSVVFNH